MEIPFLDLRRQYNTIRSELDAVINEAVASQQFVGGEKVHSFEKAFAQAHGLKYGIGVGNATDALFILLKALGIGRGKEVIVPAHGWLSAAEMIALTGATPVFADVEMKTYGLDPKSVKEKLSHRTKAIIPIHLYGQIGEMETLSDLASRHKLYLIEDAAQAHFASKGNKKAGSWGVASAFSFYPSKILGAYGDGGAILTNDNVLAQKCRLLANHGGASKNNHQIKGLNSRLDSLQAAILHYKLGHVKQWIEARNQIAKTYSQGLKAVGDIVVPHLKDDEVHNFHIYCIKTQQRDKLKAHLSNMGIQTEIHYPLATPFTPAFNSNNNPEDFPNSFCLQNQVLSLPIYPELEPAEIEYVIEQIRRFY